MAPPFRAEQIGSLLRPPQLLAARAESESNTSYAPALSQEVKRMTRDAIASAVQKQLSLSIRPITSGEYSRHIFYAGIFENLEGFTVDPEVPIPSGFRTNFPTTQYLHSQGIKTRPVVIATGKIKHVEIAYMEEWDALKSCLPPEKWSECKLTLPSPTWQHMQLHVGTAYTSTAYSSDREYFTDLATAYAAELSSLYLAGLRSVQIDDPNLTFFLTSEFIAGCKEDGVDPGELLDLYIWAHNKCLEGRPKDLHVGIHLCRGNLSHSTHVASGSYEAIAKKIFTGLDYDTFYLEYDSERAGGFEPLRHLPVGKNVVLGVVSTKSPEMEDIDRLVERVGSAADVIAIAQERSKEVVMKEVLGISPQCGFASMSVAGGLGMTEERMWEKLVLLRDLANRIWGANA